MADFYSGSPVTPFDSGSGYKTLSGILGIKAQQLDLQKSQIDLAQAQRAQQARQFVSKLMQTGVDEQGNSIRDENGDPDPQKSISAISRNVPADLAQPVIQNILKTQSDKVGLQKAGADLDATERKMLMGPVQAAALDGDVDSAEAGVDSLVKAHPEMENAAKYLKSFLPHLRDPDPAKRAHYAQSIAAHLQGGQEVETRPQGATQDTGSQISQGTVAPPVAGGGFTAATTATKTPGPQVLKDAYDRQYVYDPATNTVRPVGTGAAPQTGKGKGVGGFVQPVPQQKEIEGELETTRKADADYGVNRHVNDQILRLSKDTATGPGTDVWHHSLGAIAGPFGGNNVADYQTIGAYLDRQAALSAKQMGLPDTNAGLATAASLSGTTGYQPGALQTKVRLTDALVEGAHQYRQGLDKVVGTGQNQDLSRYQEYRAAWSANFDPNVFRVENALKRGDNEELAAIKKEVGSKGMAELKRKSDNLHKLREGEIPSER